MENFLNAFNQFPAFNSALAAGLLIFARFMGFLRFAPVVSRKEVPTLVKVGFSLVLTIIFLGVLHKIVRILCVCF